MKVTHGEEIRGFFRPIQKGILWENQVTRQIFWKVHLKSLSTLVFILFRLPLLIGDCLQIEISLCVFWLVSSLSA